MKSVAAFACLLVALCLAACGHAHPGARGPRYAVPARTMMFTGYFRGHHYPHSGGGGFRHYAPRNYEPEGAMTAFAAGNTVAAGSYYGNNGGAAAPAPDCGLCNGNGIPAGDEAPVPSPPEVIPVNGAPLPDELPAADAPAYPVDEPEPEPAAPAPAPELPPATEGPSFDAVDPQEPEDAPAPPPTTNGNGNGNGNGKKNGNGNGKKNGNGNGNGKSKPRADDDYSEEEEEDAPFPVPLPGKRGRGRGSGVYNTYFPMIFGGYPGSGRSGGGAAGGETPGVATAIANSFSRGRGAVATSHATAYGGPHLLGGNGAARKAASRRANGNGSA